MYDEFKRLALEDAKAEYRYGLECLFRFFSYGLEKHFRPDLFLDFQRETLKDIEAGQLYGLEKFWAFLKYYRHSGQLEVDSLLQAKLKHYKAIDDFRVDAAMIVQQDESEKQQELVGAKEMRKQLPAGVGTGVTEFQCSTTESVGYKRPRSDIQDTSNSRIHRNAPLTAEGTGHSHHSGKLPVPSCNKATSHSTSVRSTSVETSSRRLRTDCNQQSGSLNSQEPNSDTACTITVGDAN